MLGIPHRRLTDGIPGTGGRIKQLLEDFVVEEVPLYEPCDEGEHVYFGLEKTDMSTIEVLERLSRALGREFEDVGFAGLKDRKGITRQVFSVSGVTPEDVLALSLPQVTILWARRHRNKLRVGHLRGNRFTVRIRSVEAVDRERVEATLAVIEEKGMPNYYGPQRFGARGEAQWIGRSLLCHDDRDAVRRILGNPSPSERNPDMVAARYCFLQYRWTEALEKFPRAYREERKLLRHLLRHGENYRGARRRLRMEILKLYISAYQSYLFNRVVEQRLERSGNEPGRFYPADIAFLHRNGAVFRVDDPLALEERSRAFEISPSGPLFGKKMPIPEEGLQAEIEGGVLASEHLTHASFHQLQQWCGLEGGRRPVRVRVEDLEWHFESSDLVLRFFLPKGSFATTFLREIMKNEEIASGFDASPSAPAPVGLDGPAGAAEAS